MRLFIVKNTFFNINKISLTLELYQTVLFTLTPSRAQSSVVSLTKDTLRITQLCNHPIHSWSIHLTGSNSSHITTIVVEAMAYKIVYEYSDVITGQLVCSDNVGKSGSPWLPVDSCVSNKQIEADMTVNQMKITTHAQIQPLSRVIRWF